MPFFKSLFIILRPVIIRNQTILSLFTHKYRRPKANKKQSLCLNFTHNKEKHNPFIGKDASKNKQIRTKTRINTTNSNNLIVRKTKRSD